MSILLDTSVLVAAMVESHPDTGIIGGATYDGLILHAAAKAHVAEVGGASQFYHRVRTATSGGSDN